MIRTIAAALVAAGLLAAPAYAHGNGPTHTATFKHHAKVVTHKAGKPHKVVGTHAATKHVVLHRHHKHIKHVKAVKHHAKSVKHHVYRVKHQVKKAG